MDVSNEAKKNTQAMLDQFSSTIKALDELQDLLLKLEPGDPNEEKVAVLEDGIFCARLSLTLYKEANAAVQAGAWFAAAAVSASALEAVLLYKCLLSQEEIEALPKSLPFRKSASSEFRKFARTLDLRTLLDIAKELSWEWRAGVIRFR
jgi:hypothetical protein